MNLQERLDNHLIWLSNQGGCRADLKWVNLEKANLRKANLRKANLEGANLRKANLRKANLEEANLEGANLKWADLEEANLEEANLEWADLEWANLRKANLEGANLKEANLRKANLKDCARFLTARIDDQRGYELKVWKEENEIWVSSGCHSFSKNKAIAHWSSNSYQDKSRGNRYVATINFLAKMLEETD